MSLLHIDSATGKNFGSKFVGLKFVGSKFFESKFFGSKFFGSKFLGSKFLGRNFFLKDIVLSLKEELAGTVSNLLEKDEGEDRAMKAGSKLKAELEDEIENYASERSTKKYKNIQSRLTQITKEMKVLVATSPANITLKEK